VVRLTWTLFITPLNVTSVEPGIDVFRKEADGQWRIKTSTLTRLREDIFNGLFAVYLSPRLRAVLGRLTRRWTS